MNKSQKTITFLWGLPGSGKTTYADKASKSDNVIVIDVDKISLNTKSLDKILNLIAWEIRDYFSLKRKHIEIIIDSLLCTNAQARKIIDYFNNDDDLKEYDLIYKIIYWEEDREACILNDEIRDRDKKARTEIECMPYEVPDLNILTELNSSRILKQKVVKMHPVIKLLMDYGIEITKPSYYSSGIDTEKLKLYSESWKTGGHWGNCWGDSGEVEPEPPPISFLEFDSTLEKICPNLQFLQYKKLYNVCCGTETNSEYGYYGSHTYYARYICDLVKLYDLLLDLNLIKET